MADIKKIKVGSATYDIRDATAARSNHTHTPSEAGAAAAHHLYHTWDNNTNYYDSYEGGNMFRIVTENMYADCFRFQASTVSNLEYYNGSSWASWTFDLSNLFDGNARTGVSIPYANRKFRFQLTANGGWPTTALFMLQGTWFDDGGWPNGQKSSIIIETRASTSDAWSQKASFDLSGVEGMAGHTLSSLHTGNTLYRITIEIAPWTKTSNKCPLQRLCLFSNYNGGALETLSYTGTGNITTSKSISAGSFIENGTSLANKYLGKTAKAADADKLDGNDSTYYLNLDNINDGSTRKLANYLPLSGGSMTGDLALSAASGNSPRLTFQRGTLTDTYNDWSLYDNGGYLYIQQRGQGSTDWETIAQFTQSAVNFAGTVSASSFIESGDSLENKYIAKRLTAEKGDMIYASNNQTPNRLKIGEAGQFLSVANGVPTWVSNTDETITLAKNLYAYADIGKITGASNTSPKLVANKGDTLKTVFNNVFGTQQDEQPSINTNGVNISKSQGTTSFGGGEYGESISDTTDTITFTLNNSATAQYGYRCGNTKTTTSNATFKYAIKKQNNADIVITLPANKTATVVSNYGTLVSSSKGTDSSTNNILYCNFNNDKKVKIQISLAAGNTTTNNQTRYGVITGSVTLGDAQTSNGTKIDKFLTYLENDATTTDYYSGGTKSTATTKYTISAGYVPYGYTLDSSVPSSLPTSGRSNTKPTEITVSGGNSSTYLYIFVPSNKSDITSLSASGFDVPFSKVESNKSLVVNNNKSANYKVFKTNNSVKADTFKIA